MTIDEAIKENDEKLKAIDDMMCEPINIVYEIIHRFKTGNIFAKDIYVACKLLEKQVPNSDNRKHSGRNASNKALSEEG